MPEPNRPFRWDLVRPDQLGTLLEGTQEPDLWFLRELISCAGKILARSAGGDLYFVGRSADSIFDLLSGALGPDRLHQLPLSLGLVEHPLLGALDPAETAQLRCNLAALGLTPADLARGPRPVVFVDLVASGGTFELLHRLLREWAAEDRVTWAGHLVRFVGVTTRKRTSPNTWRWQQHLDLRPAVVRNVSLDAGVWSYFGDRQTKLTRSFDRSRWSAEDAREPAHDTRTRQALAEAVALVEAGRTREVRDRLIRAISAEPAIAEPWLRALITRLRKP